METYEDRPYLIPFLVKGSLRAVIIAPGGGFCTKSMEDEGAKTAQMLNSYGISAFVLWYRLNPYRDPVPYLDMQRAIRYVRFHADDFGIHQGKIGIMGFSAGGYVAGASMLRLKNKQVECEGYQKDAIDDTDAGVAFAALLYPVVES
ncbi:MAG: alpha/beta hydrolase [Lachnospiraceae bacterium]|nr:alpha/beta hydrolase [Lachnospiraceae bacterium]